MNTIADLLGVKGNDVYAIRAGATVYDAISTMVTHNVGALVVLEEGMLLGVITERDYLRRIAVEGRTSKTTFVSEIMTKDPLTVTPGATIERCMTLMTDRHVRHLPVLDSGRLVGIVSIGDIVKSLIREQATQIRDLTEYIHGRC